MHLTLRWNFKRLLCELIRVCLYDVMCNTYNFSLSSDNNESIFYIFVCKFSLNVKIETNREFTVEMRQ